MLKRIIQIAKRECGIMLRNPIYGFCMVVFPLLVILFFTSLMSEGLPTDMPVGVVDLDDTPTTRHLIRTLDSFQTTKIVAHYPNLNEAREAIQSNEIYAFLLIPKGTTDGLLASRQPDVSFYYSSTTLVAGSMLYRDLKTATTLAAASVGSAKLSALGKRPDEIKSFLQPIAIDLHMIGNPWSDYNVYLTTSMVPGVLMIFIFLLTAYSIGTELKFRRSHEWMEKAGGNIYVAIAGKMLPQTLVFLLMFFGFEYYIYGALLFPHPGGVLPILLLGFLAVLSAQCFGIFVFGLMPSLRMSMSICSLWAVLSFSASGSTFPTSAMSPMIEALAQLFPLRHYYMIYQSAVFNGFPLGYSWLHIVALLLFIMLPLFTIKNIKRAMLEYVYIP
ncbi:MAG: ABC transporter permease [Prevotella sp.]|nr:ABC transporter permease [Prevotella sp.]